MIKVLESWKADYFWGYPLGSGILGSIQPKKKLTCSECNGNIVYIAPHHLQCEKCYVVHKIEDESLPHSTREVSE